MADYIVTHETTPNPESMKFVVNQNICTESTEYKHYKETQNSPLAEKLFGFPWIDKVFIGPNFITISKQDWVKWDKLADPIAGLIKEHLDRGELVVYKPEALEPMADDSPQVQKIKEIINTEIRPAVATDGGDIIFHKYENHIVYVFMRGACYGCPKSDVTLKIGIEARLKEVLPEIKEVIAL